MNTEIRELLIQRAIENKPIYYGEIMSLLGLEGGIQEDHNELSNVLADISIYEHQHQRHLLSAIATYSPQTTRQKNGETHGNGFYELAEQLGKGKRSELRRSSFGIEEMARCKDYWSNPEHHNEHPKTAAAHKFDFFAADEIDFLDKWGGSVYDKNNSEHIAAKNYIMNSLGSKTVYWSRELIKKLPGFDTFNWRMWSQKGWENGTRVAKFKHYTWARIYKKGDDHKDIFFTIGADGKRKELVYKLDYYFEANSNLSAAQKTIVDTNIPENLRWKSINVADFPNYNWDRLLKETSDFILENAHIYDKLIDLAWGNKNVDEVFKDFLRKQNPQLKRYAELPKLNPSFTGHDTDHIADAIEKKEIGDAGEELVLNYEKNKLREMGKEDLASKVACAKDGEGYDVLSYNDLGESIYIEVKTTRGNQNMPFDLSLNEYLFAEKYSDSYVIYRLYNYDDELNTADFYIIENTLENLLFQPTGYKVYNKQ